MFGVFVKQSDVGLTCYNDIMISRTKLRFVKKVMLEGDVRSFVTPFCLSQVLLRDCSYPTDHKMYGQSDVRNGRSISQSGILEWFARMLETNLL